MGFIESLVRRKTISEDTLGDTNLARVLGLVDLSCLAIGSTLGLGIYVLAGDVAKNEAGPAVVISFLVAAVASLFAALCYAEFAARVPRAGSAYVYSYVCVGEFIAFVIGWNLILEYVIGTASVARGYSTYVDSIFDKKMARAFTDCCGMSVDFLSPYPDFFAFTLVLFLSALLALGVKESTRFNNVFTVCNLVVVVYVIVCGLFKADIANWQVDPAKIDDPNHEYKLGTGGFFPFGFGGMMAGAARCFYGFVGFDAVATTGEEAKNPQRAIPLAIIIGLTVIFFAYFGVSSILTLMYPYYLQQEDAPIPYVFHQLGWESARWIVTVGALFGLSSSLLGALFPLPRILYAMARDGLIFRCMAAIHPRFQTPFWSTLFAGLFSAIMASVFDLEQLVDMMSIGTLLAYTLVGVCVLVLRYRDESIGMVMHDADGATAAAIGGSTDRLLSDKPGGGLLAQIFNTVGHKEPTHASAQIVNYITIIYGVLTVGFCALIVYGADAIMDVQVWALVLTVLLGAAMLLCIAAVFLQPQSKAHLFFKVPLVPFLPMLSVFVNVYLMMKLSSATWIRFGGWMAIGFVMYFGYGIWFSNARGEKHSSEESRARTARNRSADLTLQEMKHNLELPTITIEPATPLAGSASATRRGARGDELESPDSQSEQPVFEISVETRPKPILSEELHGEVNEGYDGNDEMDDVPCEGRTKDLHVKRPDRTAEQESDMLFMSQLVKKQRGLHAVIVAVLKNSWSETGRGRQLAVHQRKFDEGSLRVSYLAPPPAMPEYGDGLRQLASEDKVRHEAICRYLGVPADGKPHSILVSAEVHSEESDIETSDEKTSGDCQVGSKDTSTERLVATSEDEIAVPSDDYLTSSKDPLAATVTADDPLVAALACADPTEAEGLSDHLTAVEGPLEPVSPSARLDDKAGERDSSKHESDSGDDNMKTGEVQEMASLHQPDDDVTTPHESLVSVTVAPEDASATSALLQTVHGSICACLERHWIDLGKGAMMADEQRARYANIAVTPAPPAVEEPPMASAMSPSELEALSQVITPIHEQIVACLAAPVAPPTSTPPNTPTGQRRSKSPLIPLGLSLSSPSTPSPPAVGARPRRPLSRALSGEAGFSTIPPQSPDSPYAKRVGTKFVIIPVDDGTDSEREDEAVEGADAEVMQAMRSVQQQVQNVLARADTNSEDGDDETTATPTASDDAPSSDRDVITPTAQGGQGEGQTAQDGGTGESSGDTAALADHPTPEIRHVMSSVLNQLRSSQKKRIPPPPPTPPTPLTPLSPLTAAPPARRTTNPKLAAAPPEPSMKDKLDQIIAEAVAKAARRVAEHPSSSGDESADPATSESVADGAAKSSTPASDSPSSPAAVASVSGKEPEPEPQPRTDRFGNGMHRVRSKKQKSIPSIDMRELMARFEKKST